MTLVELLITGLATWQAIEVWHHGEIFAAWRARLEVREGFWVTVLRCPFCLSVWVAELSAFVMLVSPFWLETWWPKPKDSTALDALCFVFWAPMALLRLFVHGLAAARLANLGNDVFHRWCKTPRQGQEIPETLPEDPGTSKTDLKS